MNAYLTNAMSMMTLPMQMATQFWANYYRSMSTMMSATLPPVAAEPTDAAAAGAAAVAKGTRMPGAMTPGANAAAQSSSRPV